MTSREELLAQIEEIATQLVAAADQLKRATLTSFTEEELDPLQQHQDQLMARLIELDAMYRMHYSEHAPQADHASTRIKKLLDQFQRLNDAFLDNVRRAKGVIQFESDLFRKTTRPVDEITRRFSEATEEERE